jgi:hypothetical protein
MLYSNTADGLAALLALKPGMNIAFGVLIHNLFNIKLKNNDMQTYYVTAKKLKLNELGENVEKKTKNTIVLSVLLDGLRHDYDMSKFNETCDKLTQLEHYLTVDLTIVKEKASINAAKSKSCMSMVYFF